MPAAAPTRIARPLAPIAAARGSRSSVAGASPARRSFFAPPTSRSGPGQGLLPPIRSRLETTFGTPLDSVRVHQNAAAARQVGARAFAFGPNIVLGEDARPDDLPLMAHEAAHTIQQRGGSQPQTWTSRGGDAHEREAQQASQAALRGEHFTVTGRTHGQRLQRFGLGDALDYFADKANLIPGFRMFTIILGVNPINMSHVERSAANILRALIEFIPGGGLITQALDNHGIFDKIGNWVEPQIRALGMVGSAIKQAVTDFIGTLKWSDVFDLGGVWDRAKRIFTDPIDRIINFAKGLVTGILQLIKEAILKPIAKLAEGTDGYTLLKAVLGKDPITDDPVPQTAENLIGPFMKLIGQEGIWENMKKANAIPRAFAWFQGALSGLLGFVRQVPALFIAAFKSLEIADIILVPLAFAKLAKVFGGFLGKFFSWAGGTIWNLLEIIFDVLSPGAFGYVKKTGAALKSILKNPLPFVGNLVKAAKLGFTNFADHFLTHLKNGLLDWLTGSLTGVYIPQALSLPEIGKFVLSVLGITWANIRAKLVKALGPNGEKIMSALETTFDIVVAFVKGGPAAAWDVIKDKLSSLKDQVVGGIISMVIETVVSKAVPKLIAMFIPGAGFISAIISIYDTVMVFVKKISKIIQVVTGFINSIVAIANGAIGAAADKVESTLAGLLSLAISFLAGFVSLGNVADKVLGVVKKIQAAVDKALDTAIAWIIGKAKAVIDKLFGKDKTDERTPQQKQDALDKAITEAQALQSDPKANEASIKKGLGKIKSQYKMKSLDLVVDSEDETGETLHILGEINPKKPTKTCRITKDGKVGPLGIVRKMLTWEQATLDHFLKDEIWKSVTALAGEYESAEIDIRHKVSISDTIANTDKAIIPKNVDEATAMLIDKKHKPATKTKPGIVAAARNFLQEANNDKGNLFLGPARANRGIGKRYDPGEGGKATDAKHDKQKDEFVEKWGFKDEEFKITIERKSKKRGTVDVSETRRSTGSMDAP